MFGCSPRQSARLELILLKPVSIATFHRKLDASTPSPASTSRDGPQITLVPQDPPDKAPMEKLIGAHFDPQNCGSELVLSDGNLKASHSNQYTKTVLLAPVVAGSDFNYCEFRVEHEYARCVCACDRLATAAHHRHPFLLWGAGSRTATRGLVNTQWWARLVTTVCRPRSTVQCVSLANTL